MESAGPFMKGPLFILLLALLSTFLMPKEVGYDRNGIAFLGDSITIGYYASAKEKTYPSIFLKHLREHHNINAGGKLFISVQARRDFDVVTQAMKTDRPIVMIEFGVHGVAEGISEEEYRAGYRLMLDCIVGGDMIVVGGTVPWLGWPADSEQFARGEAFSRIIREEAARKDVEVADVWEASKLREDFLSRPNEPAFLPDFHGDSFHPGDAGHALMAELYADALDRAAARGVERPYDRACR